MGWGRASLEVWRERLQVSPLRRRDATPSVEMTQFPAGAVAVWRGPVPWTLVMVSRSWRATARGKPSLVKTSEPERQRRTSPSSVEKTCSPSFSSSVRWRTVRYLRGSWAA